MTLKQASLLAAMGLCLSFGVRLLGAVRPRAFLDRAGAGLGAGLLLAGGLALIAFLLVFYRREIKAGQWRLKAVTVGAILGLTVGLLPDLQGLLRVSGVAPASPFVAFSHFSPLAPWVAGVTALAFFLVLRREARASDGRRLARAALAGAVGTAAFLLAATAVGLLFLLAAAAAHSPVVPKLLQLAAIPVLSVGLLSLLYFFVSCYRHCGSPG